MNYQNYRSYFKESEKIMLLCDECKLHSYSFLDNDQKRIRRRQFSDCKKIIYDSEGHELGQCGCYGPEHGEGEYI